MSSEAYKEFFLENGYAKVDSILSKKTLELCRKSYDAVFESKETGKHRHDLGGHVESKGMISLLRLLKRADLEKLFFRDCFSRKYDTVDLAVTLPTRPAICYRRM